MRGMIRAAVAASVLAGVRAPCAAGDGGVDPRGVFFHSYAGPSAAVEWIHIWEEPGPRRYTFSDIRGIAPYAGTIGTDGGILWDTSVSQSGSGTFDTNDTATQTLLYQGGSYSSTLRRAPGTDAEFLTRIESRDTGSASAAGEWSVTVQTLDPQSGAVLTTTEQSATTTVTDDLLRISLADGRFFQGVFETETTAGFRVVLPAGGLATEYKSFVGSSTSVNENLLGDFRMTGEDSFQAVMLMQTRRPPGLQDQSVLRLTAQRVPAPGVVAMIGLAAGLAARRGGRPISGS